MKPLARRCCFCTWYTAIWPLSWSFYLFRQAVGTKEVFSLVGIGTKSLPLLTGPPEHQRLSLLPEVCLHLRNTASSLTQFYSCHGQRTRWARAKPIPSSDKDQFPGPCWSLACLDLFTLSAVRKVVSATNSPNWLSHWGKFRACHVLPKIPQSVHSWPGRTVSPRLGRFPYRRHLWALS